MASTLIDKITVQTISGSTTSSTEAYITLSSASNISINTLSTTSATTSKLYIRSGDPNYSSYAKLEATNTTNTLITLSLPSVSGYLATTSITTSEGTYASNTKAVTGISYSYPNNRFEVSTVSLGEQVTYSYNVVTKVLSITHK